MTTKRLDTTDMGNRSSNFTIHKHPVDATTTLDGVYKIESVLYAVDQVRRNVPSNEQGLIIQMLLD